MWCFSSAVRYSRVFGTKKKHVRTYWQDAIIILISKLKKLKQTQINSVSFACSIPWTSYPGPNWRTTGIPLLLRLYWLGFILIYYLLYSLMFSGESSPSSSLSQCFWVNLQSIQSSLFLVFLLVLSFSILLR